MNNLSKITLPDDVMAGELYDELQAQKEDVVKEELSAEEIMGETKSKKRFKFTKPKFKGFKKGKFNKSFIRKNALVASCVILIGIAVWLNFRFSQKPEDGNLSDVETQGKILGESTFVNGENQNDDNYFSVAVINRQRVRDEAIDMLQEVVDNVETNSAIRENAFNEMTRMASETNSEINIENLVMAKGFEECVAVISGDVANVIVKSEGLEPEQIAQIQEIVYTEAGTLIDNIKIVEKN